MKITRRTKLLIVALALCFTTMIGSTFAWFTDTVESDVNTITAGNLDMVVEYKTPGMNDWAPLTETTKVFNGNAKWEPGHTEAVALKIKNDGNLAFKYQAAVNIISETASTNVYDKEFKLSDYLEVHHAAIQQNDEVGSIFMDLILGSRKSALGNGTDIKKTAFDTPVAPPETETSLSPLMPKAEHVFAFVITMPTTVGNEANYKTGTTAPSINFGLSIVATQAVSESDSFGSDYDKDATFPTITGPSNVTPHDIANFVPASNTTYALTGDFNNQNVSIVMPVGVENVVFDGTQATNINELIITQNGKMIDNATTHVGERSGKVTIKNFNVASQIDVFACKTEVEICNNTAEALSVYAGNCAINIHHNEFDANFKAHDIYQNATTTWGTNEYAVQLRIFEYVLKFDNNTVTDANGHAIGINGYQDPFVDLNVENKIESFTGNNITVNSSAKTKRAAFKVWNDPIYAPMDGNHLVVNHAAQAFIDAVLADGSNTFNITEGYDHTIFCIYDVNTNK